MQVASEMEEISEAVDFPRPVVARLSCVPPAGMHYRSTHQPPTHYNIPLQGNHCHHLTDTVYRVTTGEVARERDRGSRCSCLGYRADSGPQNRNSVLHTVRISRSQSATPKAAYRERVRAMALTGCL